MTARVGLLDDAIHDTEKLFTEVPWADPSTSVLLHFPLTFLQLFRGLGCLWLLTCLFFLCSAFPKGLHLNLEITHFFHMQLVHQALLAGKCKTHSILIAPSGRRIKISCLGNNCAEAGGHLRAFVKFCRGGRINSWISGFLPVLLCSLLAFYLCLKVCNWDKQPLSGAFRWKSQIIPKDYNIISVHVALGKLPTSTREEPEDCSEGRSSIMMTVTAVMNL